MPTFAAGTVITSDYLPWARVLADSIAEHNPGVRFAALVLDGVDAPLVAAAGDLELLDPVAVGLTSPAYDWLTAIYDGFELSCAVKPWLLSHLLATGADAAIYFDSDIFVCDSLSEVAGHAVESGLVLTAHTLEPPPADGLFPDEDIFLRSGQYNGGFVAVGRDGTDFLAWWRDRLRRDCLAWGPTEPQRFVDQRWLDLAVNYFPCRVLRDRGVNVAYWNLATRALTAADGDYRVDGEPLRFFHFSGFDPSRPGMLSKHQGEPARVVVPASGPLAALCSEYATRLTAAGAGNTGPSRLPVELPGGITLTQPVRRALRAALIESERTGLVPLSGPQDADALWSWLRAPATASGVSWYAWGLWSSQPALRQAFPRVPGADEQRLLTWCCGDGIAQGLVPAGLEREASPVRLDGSRVFVALIDTAEAVEDPELLAGLADVFSSVDEVTLVVRAGGRDGPRLAADLEPVLVRHGLSGPGSPDLLGLLEPAGPHALAPLVHAVLTRRPTDAALDSVPQARDAVQLRALADAALGRGSSGLEVVTHGD